MQEGRFRPMRALTVRPKEKSSVSLRDTCAEPERRVGELLVQSLLVGVCGTDREIIDGNYGAAPQGQDYLILGHESLGRVLAADADSPFRKGDLVVGIVRRPDPVPCHCCAAGEWDMCINGLYTERGIRGAHGYASERFVLEQQYAVRVPDGLGDAGVLLEPASVVAKAWEQVERIAARSATIAPENVLVTGAGPVGLLAALMAVQRGYTVTVLDLAQQGPKPDLVRALGAQYHADAVASLTVRPDIVLECTGSEQVVVDVLGCTAHNSITCLAGVSSGARKVSLFASQFNDSMVLENDVVFGSVNANRRHYAAGAESLRAADPRWLAQMLTRKVPLSRFEQAFERNADDVKVTLDMEG
jgi:threonine dehydrogenase-like Zn-dependent dehydrogenase